MRTRRMAIPALPITLLLTTLLLTTLGCQEQPGAADTDATAASDTHAAGAAGDTVATSDDPATAATRAALPRLFSIMVGLQGDMERISRGIWTERHDSIAAGARAVADHPMIGEEGLAKVQAALGPDIARFKAMDTHVHDLAVQLEGAARDQDLDAVLETHAQLRQGCVECHTVFRQRLRDAF